VKADLAREQKTISARRYATVRTLLHQRSDLSLRSCVDFRPFLGGAQGQWRLRSRL